MTDEYELVVSFEDQSPSYVHGYEAGLLASRMQTFDADTVASEVIEQMVHSVNRLTIERMANAWGWEAAFEDTEYPEWMSLALNRNKPKRPELRIVK